MIKSARKTRPDLFSPNRPLLQLHHGPDKSTQFGCPCSSVSSLSSLTDASSSDGWGDAVAFKAKAASSIVLVLIL
jgi:hypothetical protein